MAADLVDLAFPLEGGVLPRAHHRALADALLAALPWLAEEPLAGVHRLKLVAGEDDEALISPRTRLMLRLPRSRCSAAGALAGTELRITGHALRLKAPQQRELLPHGTLYAHFVAAPSGDEAEFLAAMQLELSGLDLRCTPVCGRWQHDDAGGLRGCSLMLYGLDEAQSLRVLHRGLGPHRRLGCGLFVPHKSAAAVGAPP